MLVDVVQHQMWCCCVALDVLMLCCCGVSGGLLLCSIWCFDVVLLCSIRCVDVVLLCSIRCDDVVLLCSIRCVDVASDVLCMQTPIWVTAQSCWHWNKIRRQGSHNGEHACRTEKSSRWARQVFKVENTCVCSTQYTTLSKYLRQNSLDARARYIF